MEMETEMETDMERSGYRDAGWSNREREEGGLFMWRRVSAGRKEGKMSGSFVISEMVILNYHKHLRSVFAARVGSRNCSG